MCISPLQAQPDAPMPEQESGVGLQQLCNPVDPNTIYRDMVKIGEGAAGEVYIECVEIYCYSRWFLSLF